MKTSKLMLSNPLRVYPHRLAYGHMGSSPTIAPTITKIKIPLNGIRSP